jgi:hypothetical protein
MDKPKREKIIWKSEVFKLGCKYFRLADLSGSAINNRVEFILSEFKTATSLIPASQKIELAKAGLSCIIGASDKGFKIKYSLQNVHAAGRKTIILNVFDEEYWPEFCALRNSNIDLINRMRNRELNIGQFVFCRTPSEMDAMMPWSLFEISKILISLISDGNMIIPSIIQEIFPTKSKKTFVAHQPGEYKSANYWDIVSAYGQVAQRLGGDVQLLHNENGHTIDYQIGSHTFDIHDDLKIWHNHRTPEYDYIMDELNSKELKPLRLHLMGAALTQINGNSKFISVNRRKADGHVGSHSLHMSLPYRGRFIYTSMLSVRFIYEAVMMDYYLSGGAARMALTDGLIIEGSPKHRPFLLDALGLDYRLKDCGASVIYAPNCYQIDKRTTLNYPSNSERLDHGGIYTSPPNEPDSPGEFRIVAIPLVMDWNCEQTAAVFDAVRARHLDAWAMDRLIPAMPTWLAELQDKKMELAEK